MNEETEPKPTHRRCGTCHYACDCREALFEECRLMLEVFRISIARQIIPGRDSPCARKVASILDKMNPSANEHKNTETK
jgi:hypothetical protein